MYITLTYHVLYGLWNLFYELRLRLCIVAAMNCSLVDFLIYMKYNLLYTLMKVYKNVVFDIRSLLIIKVERKLYLFDAYV